MITIIDNSNHVRKLEDELTQLNEKLLLIEVKKRYDSEELQNIAPIIEELKQYRTCKDCIHCYGPQTSFSAMYCNLLGKDYLDHKLCISGGFRSIYNHKPFQLF